MNSQAFCIIDGSNVSQRLDPLLEARCLPALHFCGRYRLIDFPLSNVIHSGITNVAIFPDGDYHSLTEHIKSGKFWGLDRKVDGLFVMPPKTEVTSSAKSLTFAKMREHIDYFLRSRQNYVVIYGGNIITSINFETLVAHHIQSSANITQVYYRNKPIGIYVLSKEYLIDLILRHEISPYKTIEMLIELHGGLKVDKYKHETYTRIIDSTLSYFQANLDMLNYKNGFQLFDDKWPILTKIKDMCPTYYDNQAEVSNTIASNGCHIEGKVENSILFRNVVIKRGAVVKNAVLLPHTIVGENSIVENVVADKHVVIQDGARVVGENYFPQVIPKGQRVGGTKGLRVLQVSTECYPFYKSGGLADVVADLTHELIDQGIRTDVILPYHLCLDKQFSAHLVHKYESTVVFGEEELSYRVSSYSSEGVKYYFLECSEITSDTLYGDDDFKRYELYTYLTLDYLVKRRIQYDVIHCHDWLTGLLPYFMRQYDQEMSEYFKYTKTILTIHNMMYQGTCDVSQLRIISKLETIPNEIMLYEKVNSLKAGIVLADKVTTVSPTYRQEISYPYFGEGLDRFIQMRKDDVVGILNGISYKVHNPATNLNIHQTYSLKTIHLKKENKCQMQRELGLPVRPDVPVIAMVTRIIEQKGFDLILEVFDKIMKEDVQFVLLGIGEVQYTQFFEDMMRKYPTKVSANIGFDAYNVDMIYAGSDLFLMPSRFEPCGISQMISLKYGTIPIVRETGGLKDTVVPYNEFIQDGNGFSFAHFNANDMLFIIKRALHFYYQPFHWNKIVESAMTTDLSWTKSAQQYINIYRTLIE